jgi:predicted nucleic acid binding AN1-type Zn finger protein
MADDLGAHCAECGQLDFLPFRCPDCGGRSFCGGCRLSHSRCSGAGATSRRSPSSAAGPSSLVVCPLCARGVRVGAGETPDQAHARHSRAECDPSNWQRVHRRPRCAAAGCKATPFPAERVQCGRCGALLCLRHRLPEDHGCPGLERERQQWERQRQRQQQQQEAGRAQQQGAGARLLAEAASAARKVVATGRSSAAAARPPPSRPPAAAAAPSPGNTVAGTAALRARALALPEVCPICPRAQDVRFATVAELIEHCERRHGADGGTWARARARARRGAGGEDGSSSSKCVVC